MATKKQPAKKKPESKKPATTKKAKAAADKKGKVKGFTPVNTTEPLTEFQNPKLTGRGNGQSDGIIPPVVTRSVTITSVKINKKDELIIGISKIESDGSTTKYPEEHKGRTAHPNLKFAFDSLRPHLALLCDYISTQQLKDIKHYSPQQVSNFVVRGISMNGEGYVISGHKIRKDKKTVGLNTPYTLIEEDEKTPVYG